MVHKMQRMALSSHQLVAPAASAAEKADSENTRNSENNGDPEEEAQQGDWITHQHNWTKLNRKQDWETHATHTNTENTHERMGRLKHKRKGKDTSCMRLREYIIVWTMTGHVQHIHKCKCIYPYMWTKSDTVLFKSCDWETFCRIDWSDFFQQAYNAIAVSRQMKLLALNSSKTSR